MCARAHFPLSIVQLVKKLGSAINSLFVRFLFQFVNKKENARILSAIHLICILLKIKECGIRSVVGHIYNCCIYNNAYEMKKKSIFETADFFFSQKEDVTVDVHIGYVGRSKTIIAVDKTDQDVD